MPEDREMDSRERIARPGRRSSTRPAERNAAEYALLGLIAQSEGREIHGYDLSRVFADGALGRIIRLESGMLYHYLKKLAKSGAITTRVERQSGRPDRQVHALTEAGDAELLEWLTAPVRSTREIRLDFLVKLYLARRVAPDVAATLVREQRSVMQRRAERLETQLANPQPDDDDNRFGESILRLRLGQTRSALEWLATLPESV